jgi:hypothetical protein
MRLAVALLLLSLPLLAAVDKLYLKDGTFHFIREWRKVGDRVRFYSTERREWEEIPANLVDIERTEKEITAHNAALAEETKLITEEDKAVRAQQDEILKIPQDPGVYTVSPTGQLAIFKLAESKVHNSKGRNVLRMAVPVPIVAGKGTVELEGDHSLNIVNNDRQEFYIQLSQEERFGLIRLTPHRGVRIVERLTVIPVANETQEEVDEVPTFRKQLTENGLYKIWPEKPLEPGEYAVIQYTPGKLNPQIWDFQFKK